MSLARQHQSKRISDVEDGIVSGSVRRFLRKGPSASAPGSGLRVAAFSMVFALAALGCRSTEPVAPQKPRHSVTITWVASPSPVVGYAVYRSNVSGGPFRRLMAKPVSGTTYQDNTVHAGQTYYYYVVSVNSINVESPASEVVTASVPSP